VKKLLLVAFALLPLLSSGQKIPVMDWAVGATSSTSWFAVHALATDATGNTILAGYFSGTIDMDPGPGVLTATTSGSAEYDFVIVKLDPSGNFIWGKEIGGPANEDALDLDIDASGNVYVVGEFGGTVDFDPGAGTNNVTTAGHYSSWTQTGISYG
jgi:hypothetical protein